MEIKEVTKTAIVFDNGSTLTFGKNFSNDFSEAIEFKTEDGICFLLGHDKRSGGYIFFPHLEGRDYDSRGLNECIEVIRNWKDKDRIDVWF